MSTVSPQKQRTVSMESVGEESRPSWASPNFAVDDDEEEKPRSASRKRSLECSSIEVHIYDTEITPDHTNYLIRVSSGIRTWVIKRRYKDFYYLDRQLRKNFPMLKFPTLPPKRYLRSSNDPNVVDQRKEQLEFYLHTLVGMQTVWTKNDFVLFLNDESNLMSFIWNFERMRKLKDMLGMMKVESQSETAKLNSDLQTAQRQVHELQSKLSQMEMIFLQQAVGLGDQLPNNVLRSISGVPTNSLSSQLASELKTEHKSLYDYDATTSLDDVYYADVAQKSEKSDSSQNAAGENSEYEGGFIIGGHDVDSMETSELVKAINLAQETEGQEVLKTKPGSPDEARTIAVSREIQEAIRISQEMLSDLEKTTNTPDRLKRNNLSEADLSRLSAPSSSQFSVTSSESFIDSFDVEDVNTTRGAWVELLIQQVDRVVQSLLPTTESLGNRLDIFCYVRDLVSRTLGVQLFPIGSFVSQTFLPDGDVDATAFVPKNADDSWYVKINEALCLSAFHGQSNEEFGEMSVSNVSFVNTEVKMIRSMINGISVDISTNQLPSLLSESLIERLDEFVGRNHLFKRSMLLLKAWFHYESPRFTHGGGSLCNSRDGKVSTWAIVVMLIWTFNKKGANIKYPLQAMGHFFRIFSTFDWANYSLTVFGPLEFSKVNGSINVYSSEDAETAAATAAQFFFPRSLFDMNPPLDEKNVKAAKTAVLAEGEEAPAGTESEQETRERSATVTDDQVVDIAEIPAAEYVPGILNIMDPFETHLNLLDSVTTLGYESIVGALHDGYRHYQSLCDECSKLLAFGQFADNDMRGDVEKFTKVFFMNTVARYPMPEPVANCADILTISKADLTFSLRYGQLALGGRIDQALLTQLIVVILEKKGPMPVGEIGKNLQSLLGCESLSRRLKEQFSGLKRAIENSNHPRIKMGAEHPFNPVVTLLADPQPSEASTSPATILFKHDSFLFIPYLVQMKLQAQAAKEAQSQQAKSHKPYRRQPPQILEGYSVNSQSFSSASSDISSADSYYYKKQNNGYNNNNNRSKNNNNNNYSNSPSRHGNPYYRGPPMQAMSLQGHPMYPMPMEMNYIPIPPPNGPPMYGNMYPGVPVYPAHPMQMPFPIPPPYFHPSPGSSLSSSYGQNSPMSHSPMNPSYMPMPEPLPQQQQHPRGPEDGSS